MDVRDIIVIWMQNIQNIRNPNMAVFNHETAAVVDVVLYSSKIPDNCDNDDVDVVVTLLDVVSHYRQHQGVVSSAFWIQFTVNYSGSCAIKHGSQK